MNIPNKKTIDEKQGFTIIEVVLVLAIAGLIFLMVFLALPALQRGQRDTQRKDDLSRINTQISNYQSSNRGAVPDEGKLPNFVQKYMNGSGTTAGPEYVDPSSGEGYVFIYQDDVEATPDTNQVFFKNKSLCGEDGNATTDNASARQYSLRVKLENQKAAYCIDNR